jgi:hypothetical protein
VPSILQVIGLFFVPESPKYTLIFCDDHDQALADLIKFRDSPEIAKLELKTLEHEKSKCEDSQSLSIKQLLVSSSLRWPLLMVVLLMSFQQVNFKLISCKNVFSCLASTPSCSIRHKFSSKPD